MRNIKSIQSSINIRSNYHCRNNIGYLKIFDGATLESPDMTIEGIYYFQNNVFLINSL